MANAKEMLAKTPFRGFLLGYPGSGKTGALASLANAGYKIRMLDFDGNPEPLLMNLDERAIPNVDILHFEDEMRDAGKYMEPSGIPEAFTSALKTMKNGWKYTDSDGNEVDLGLPKDWGQDTIVVLDSANTMGVAAFNRALKAANRTPMNCTHQVWGSAMADQENFIKKLRAEKNGFHLIVLSHLKLIGPEDIEQNDDETTAENKAKIAQIVPHRLYPWVLGQKLAPKIGGILPTIVLAEARERARQVQRVLVTNPRTEVDVKVPGRNLKGEYPVENGMLEIFKACGHTPPGFD